MDNIQAQIGLFLSKDKRHEESYLLLARLAAVPLLFSPDLLYKLWRNFKSFINSEGKSMSIPYLVVSDLLLSNFCRPVGYQLYKMEEEVRLNLLKGLSKPQKMQVATFLEQYAIKSFSPTEKNIQNIHLKIAKLYLHPEKFINEIKDDLLSKEKNSLEKSHTLNLYYQLEAQANDHNGLGLILSPAKNEVEDVLEIERRFLRGKLEDWIGESNIIKEIKVENSKGDIHFVENSDLERIIFEDSNFETVKIEGNSNLKEIIIKNSNIDGININNNPSLKEIVITETDIFYFQLGNVSAICCIRIINCKIEESDINNLEKLEAINSNFDNFSIQSVVEFVIQNTRSRQTNVVKKENLKKLTINETDEFIHFSELADFKNLEYLDLKNNKITSFYETILNELPNIKELYLQGNKLGGIFEEEANCLPALKEWIAKNKNPKSQNILNLEIQLNITLTEAENLDDLKNYDKNKCYIQNELGVITHLNLNECKLKYIDFLEEFTELEALSLYHNHIHDISVLSKLTKLKYLCLSTNDITDISTLKELTNLEDLSITNNKIIHFTPLVALTNLRELRVRQNKINYNFFLSALQNLENLWIDSNNLTNLGAISSLTKLKRLHIERNKIAALSEQELLFLAQLDYVNLFNNPISADAIDIIDRNYLSFVKQLIVGKTDLSGIKKLQLRLKHTLKKIYDESSIIAPNLRESGFYICNESGQVTHLNLLGFELRDLSFLQDFKQLEVLNLNGNRISKIDEIGQLTKLKKLDLGNNRIKDIEPLSKLTNLEELYLGNNQIHSLDAFWRLQNLKILELQNNKIIDIDTLESKRKKYNIQTSSLIERLYQLETLHLWGNPIATKNQFVFSLGNCLEELKYYQDSPQWVIDSLIFWVDYDCEKVIEALDETFEARNLAYNQFKAMLVIPYNEYSKKQFKQFIERYKNEILQYFVNESQKYEYQDGIQIALRNSSFLSIQKPDYIGLNTDENREEHEYSIYLNYKKNHFEIELFEFPRGYANRIEVMLAELQYVIENTEENILQQFQTFLDSQYKEVILDNYQEYLDLFCKSPTEDIKVRTIKSLLENPKILEDFLEKYLQGESEKVIWQQFFIGYINVIMIENLTFDVDFQKITISGNGDFSTLINTEDENPLNIDLSFVFEATLSKEISWSITSCNVTIDGKNYYESKLHITTPNDALTFFCLNPDTPRKDEIIDILLSSTNYWEKKMSSGLNQEVYDMFWTKNTIDYISLSDITLLEVESNHILIEGIGNLDVSSDEKDSGNDRLPSLLNGFNFRIKIKPDGDSNLIIIEDEYSLDYEDYNDDPTLDESEFTIPQENDDDTQFDIEFETPEQAIGFFLTKPNAQRDEEIKELIIKEKFFLTNIIKDKLIEELKFKVVFSEFDLNLVTFGLGPITFDKNLSLGYTNKDGELQIAGSGKINLLIKNSEKDIEDSYLFSFDIEIIQDANYEWGLSDDNVNIIDVYPEVKVEETNFLEIALKDNITLEAKVVSANIGGLILDIRGKQVFLPSSQIADGYIDQKRKYKTSDLNKRYLNKLLRVKIIDFDKVKNNYIASCKPVIEEDIVFATHKQALDFFLANPDTTRKDEIINILSKSDFLENLMYPYIEGEIQGRWRFDAQINETDISKINKIEAKNDIVIISGTIDVHFDIKERISKIGPCRVKFDGLQIQKDEKQKWRVINVVLEIIENSIPLTRAKKQPIFDKKEALDYLAQSQIEESFKLVNKFTAEKSNKDDFQTSILLQAEYNELKKNEMMGSISSKEAALKRNQLNASLLELINTL